MNWQPTCELRVAIWHFEGQVIERLQQKWIDENDEFRRPQWRNVVRWPMHTTIPLAADFYEG